MDRLAQRVRTVVSRLDAESIADAGSNASSNLWGLAVYYPPWRGYINCYLLARPNGSRTMVDGCRPEHAPSIRGALAAAGVPTTPESITLFAATHRHIDHTGFAAHAVRARRLVHAADRDLMPPEVAELFGTYPCGETGSKALFELDAGAGLVGPPLPPLKGIHLGQHTPGSVAIYDPLTKALFTGDHLCFPRRELPASGGLAVPAESMHRYLLGFVRRWAKAPGRTTPQLGLLDEFAAGLARLRGFDARLLCTGHGPVLAGDIPALLDLLVAAAC